MIELSDIEAGAVIDFCFATKDAGGNPSTLSSATVVLYKSNATANLTSGLTLTTDFNSVTGLNQVHFDSSADGVNYVAGKDYSVVLKSGTVDGQVISFPLAHFSIQNRTQRINAATGWGGSALPATATAQTVQVDGSGYPLVRNEDGLKIPSEVEINSIKAQTDKFLFDGSNNVKANTEVLPSPPPSGYGGGLTDAEHDKLLSIDPIFSVVASAVDEDGTLSLVQGDDYTTNPFSFTATNSPDFTGGSCSLGISLKTAYDAGTDSPLVTLTGAISVNSSVVTFTYTPSATDLASLASYTTPPGGNLDLVYQQRGVTSAGKKVTTHLGACTLSRKVLV